MNVVLKKKPDSRLPSPRGDCARIVQGNLQLKQRPRRWLAKGNFSRSPLLHARRRIRETFANFCIWKGAVCFYSPMGFDVLFRWRGVLRFCEICTLRKKRFFILYNISFAMKVVFLDRFCRRLIFMFSI